MTRSAACLCAFVASLVLMVLFVYPRAEAQSIHAIVSAPGDRAPTVAIGAIDLPTGKFTDYGRDISIFSSMQALSFPTPWLLGKSFGTSTGGVAASDGVYIWGWNDGLIRQDSGALDVRGITNDNSGGQIYFMDEVDLFSYSLRTHTATRIGSLGLPATFAIKQFGSVNAVVRGSFYALARSSTGGNDVLFQINVTDVAAGRAARRIGTDMGDLLFINVTFAGGKYWTFKGTTIFTIDPNTGKATNTGVAVTPLTTPAGLDTIWGTSRIVWP